MALILDGNNLAFRIWSTEAGDLTTREGERVGVCFGFIKTLQALLSLPEFANPSHRIPAVVVWDIGKCKRRKELYPEYKGNREPNAKFEDFKEQVNVLKELISYMPIHSLELRDHEGDDLIAACEYYFQDSKNIIVSADKDLASLVDINTSLFKLGMFSTEHTLVTKANFEEKMLIKYKKSGEKMTTPIPYNRMIEYKAVCGDKSDNIKGVEGVGDVALAGLFKTFGGIPEALAAEYIEDPFLAKAVNKIKASKDIMDRNYDLIDLKKYLNSEILVYVGEKLIQDRVADVSKIMEFYKQKEFSSLMLSLNTLLNQLK